ncbi:MAG TPA: hypothetical protein ENJ80_07575 [Gammaproteobacteria bacterium]|nr:hypothetical protein [Gammaproteobacteria bacterium]
MDSISIVTTLRAPLHESMSFVHYHINKGISHLFLYFDDPDDPAIECLAHYDNVTCVQCDKHYWTANAGTYPQFIEDRQIFNANHALALARDRNLDWIIHIDSDELLYTNTSLEGLLSGVSKDIHVIRFTMREAVPSKLKYRNFFMEVHDFKVPPTPIQGQSLASKNVRQALYHGEYFRGHTGSKSAVRLDSPVKSLHIHFPIESVENLTVRQSNDIVLLHYDCCDFAAWQRKCVRRIDGTAAITRTFVRPNRQLQLKEFTEAYQEGHKKMLELYKRMYFIPKKERATLEDLGLLVRIVINNRLFDSPG